MKSDPFAEIRQALSQMVSLDMGMVDGRAISGEKQDAAYCDLLVQTEALFVTVAQAHCRRAADFAREVPVYQRPKRLDLQRWLQIATHVKRPPAERVPLDQVPRELGEQLCALDAFAAAHPRQLALQPPAGLSEIEEAEEYLGVTLTPELRALYRWCNGFSWGHTASDENAPLCLLPIHRVQRVCDLVGHAPRRGRVKSLPKAKTKIMEHPDRLTVFDALDGSFVSALCADDGGQALIDDYREGPTAVSSESLAALIAHLLDPARVAADGRWFPEISNFF